MLCLKLSKEEVLIDSFPVLRQFESGCRLF
jgi:hypothetical protein